MIVIFVGVMGQYSQHSHKGHPMKPIFLLLILCFACSHIETPYSPPTISQTPPVATEIMKPLQDVFSTASKNESLKHSVKIANCVVRSESFLKELSRFPKYDFTTSTPDEVEQAFRKIKSIKVATYQTKNPWSKALATTYASDRETVWINSRQLPRDLPSLVNTLIHEGSHLIGFSHGDNSPVGKQKSVPYGVGEIAERHITPCESSNF